MIRRETGVILIENFVIAPAEAVGLSRESDWRLEGWSEVRMRWDMGVS
jgi:hypothetical protein